MYIDNFTYVIIIYLYRLWLGVYAENLYLLRLEVPKILELFQPVSAWPLRYRFAEFHSHLAASTLVVGIICQVVNGLVLLVVAPQTCPVTPQFCSSN